ncbi:hypothetical protein FRB90_000510, partial [Tulasnella sp. 427]
MAKPKAKGKLIRKSVKGSPPAAEFTPPMAFRALPHPTSPRPLNAASSPVARLPASPASIQSPLSSVSFIPPPGSPLSAPVPDALTDCFGSPSSPELSPFFPPFEAHFATEMGMGDYIQRRRELLDILKSLHSTGTQDELDLPQIVVIGSQSVGKSSLIESMSGYGQVWSCTISLRLHDIDPNGEYLPTFRQLPFGSALYSPVDVEKMLRRAQRAILRPHLDPSLFLDDSDLHMFGIPLSFSRDCVCIEVSGPDVPDLYFYDLPGIIANVADEEHEADIALVENLAKSYIQKNNCIVLLVLSCETDFENQGAGRLVLKNPALRQRTVGVLTKVDRIQAGTASKWLRLLRGEEQPLFHGWFCVKQRSPSELARYTPWEEAKALEKEFFETVAPWSELDVRQRGRLGSEKLADRLGAILSDLVSRELPGIRTKISKELAQVEIRLLRLARPEIKDRRRLVISLLQNFSKTLSKHLQGLSQAINSDDPEDWGLLNALHDAYERFRERVYATAPQFRPWSSAMLLDDEMEKMLDEGDDAAGLGETCVMHVDEVIKLAKNSRTRELPGNYPFSVKEQLIMESVKQWGALARQSFSEVRRILERHVDRLLENHFEIYGHGGLKDAVRVIVSEQILKCASAATDNIEGLVRSEMAPYTQNDDYFLAYKTKVLARYEAVHQELEGKSDLVAALCAYRPEDSYSTGDRSQWKHLEEAISSLERFGIAVKAEDLIGLLPKHDLSPALDIMAEVRAYFQVAYKRFSDNIPKQIDTDLVQRLDEVEDGLDVALLSIDLSAE